MHDPVSNSHSRSRPDRGGRPAPALRTQTVRGAGPPRLEGTLELEGCGSPPLPVRAEHRETGTQPPQRAARPLLSPAAPPSPPAPLRPPLQASESILPAFLQSGAPAGLFLAVKSP